MFGRVFDACVAGVLSVLIGTCVFVWSAPRFCRHVYGHCGSVPATAFVVWLVSPSWWWEIVKAAYRG